MRRELIGILSLLFSSFLFVVPASAVNLPDCAAPDGTTHFTLVAQEQIIFEGGQTSKTIAGNLLVTGATGFVRVGKNTHLTGTVIAAKIIFDDSLTSTIDSCEANEVVGKPALSGNGCVVHGLNTPDAFTAFANAHLNCPLGITLASSSLCGPTPVVDNCVIGKPQKTVSGPNNSLVSGCYGALVLENNAELNLPGPQPYTFSSIRMKAGSDLNGVPSATVNVNGQFITEPGVAITNVNLNSASAIGDVVAILNNSTLTNVVINAPFGRCHPHTGTALKECSEMCCKTLDVQPTSAECGENFVCKCDPGFHFEDNTSRICVRD